MDAGRPTSSFQWREPGLWLVLALLVVGYSIPLFRMPARGEEPRWAQVAHEMRLHGDLLTCRQQGTLFLSRPPLAVWSMLAAQELFQSRAVWVVRLPSVLAILLTCVLIYRYTRVFVSPLAATAATMTFAFSGEMFQLGAIAESDAQFIPLLGGSLLLWHLGLMQGWSPWRLWITSYALMALALLCKGGAQPPVYLLGTIFLYLVFTKNLRLLLSWAHLAGVATAVLIVAAWLVPFVWTVGSDNASVLWFADTVTKFHSESSLYWRHLLVFPAEVYLSNLPFVSLLVLWAAPRIRQQAAHLSKPLLFNGLALAVAFPTCWLAVSGQTRYLAPLYPCLAVLVGLTLEAALRAAHDPLVRRIWQGHATLYVLALGLLGVVITGMGVVGCFHDVGRFQQPLPVALLFGLPIVAIAAVLWLTGRALQPTQVGNTLLAIALGTILICGGWLPDLRARLCPDTHGVVARLHALVPAQAGLVSFELVSALFPYYYGEYIPCRSYPRTAAELKQVGYFCVEVRGDEAPRLPGPWIEIGRAPIERARHRQNDGTGRVVIVGRAL